MFLSGIVPSAIYGILALSIPESPRYLVAKLRDSDAIKVLKMVVGSREAQPKLDEIRKTLGSETRRSLRDLRGPALGLLPIVWIGILLSVFQQFAISALICKAATAACDRRSTIPTHRGPAPKGECRSIRRAGHIPAARC